MFIPSCVSIFNCEMFFYSHSGDDNLPAFIAAIYFVRISIYPIWIIVQHE